MSCPPFLLKIRAAVARVEEWFLCFLLSTMVILACMQILLRDIFSSGLIWADPLLRYLVLWSGLIGAAIATRQGKHIAIDVASHLIPEKYFSWLVALIDLFSAFVCAALTYASVLFILSEKDFGGTRLILGIPSWVLNLIFPLAFALIAVRFILVLIANIRHILNLEPCEPPSSMARKVGE